MSLFRTCCPLSGRSFVFYCLLPPGLDAWWVSSFSSVLLPDHSSSLLPKHHAPPIWNLMLPVIQSLILHNVKMCHLWLINMEAEALLQGRILCKDPSIKNVTAVSVGRCSMRRMCRTGEVSSSIRLTGSWDLNPIRVQGLLYYWVDTLSEACSEDAF